MAQIILFAKYSALMLSAVVLASGCDKPAAVAESTTPQTAATTSVAEAEPLQIGPVEAGGCAVDGAPSTEDLQAHVRKALDDRAIAHRVHRGEAFKIACIVKLPEPKPGEQPVRAIGVTGQIGDLVSRILHTSDPDRDLGGELKTALTTLVDDLQAQHHLASAPPEAIAKLVTASRSSEFRQRALARLREAPPKQARDGLRAMVRADEPQIILGAAAALVQSRDPSNGSLLVEAAGRLSSNQNYPALVALLFQLGELGGPEIEIYLSTVAEGHPHPEVQKSAAEALSKLKKGAR